MRQWNILLIIIVVIVMVFLFVQKNVIQTNEILLEKNSESFMEARHIVLKGTNEEIGEALADIARESYDTKLVLADSNSGIKRREYIKTNYPILFERMKGVAKSYNIAQDSNYDSSSLFYDTGPMTACSAISFPKSVTTNDHTLVSRTLDFYTVGLSEFMGLPKNENEHELYSRAYVLEIYPDVGHSSLVFGGEDLLNGVIDGINSKGLSVSSFADNNMTKLVTNVKKITGMTHNQLVRQILDSASNIEEAKQIIQSHTDIEMVLDAMHFLITEKSGKALIAEMDNKNNWHFTESNGKEPVPITNHQVRLYPDVSTFPETNETDYYNTFNRYRKLAGFISEHNGKYSPEDAEQAMTLVYGHSNTQTEGAAKPLPLKTLWVVNFDLQEKSATVKYYLRDGPVNPETNIPTLEFTKEFEFKLFA